jgi:hypothetical protein
MADRLDLTGEIASAVDGAALRGHTLALAYLGDDGYPSVSFRGSTHVHGPEQLAIWARKADDGLAKVIAEQGQDPERKGVAVLIDVESVSGFGAEGPFLMERAAVG